MLEKISMDTTLRRSGSPNELREKNVISRWKYSLSYAVNSNHMKQSQLEYSYQSHFILDFDKAGD